MNFEVLEKGLSWGFEDLDTMGSLRRAGKNEWAKGEILDTVKDLDFCYKMLRVNFEVMEKSLNWVIKIKTVRNVT